MGVSVTHFPKNIRRKTLWLILKVILGVIPIWWIFSGAKFDKLMGLWGKVPHTAFIFIVLLSATGILLTGFRWWFLLHAFIKNMSLSTVINCHLKAVVCSIIVPSSFSQDIIRAAILAKNTDYRIVWGSSWVSRLLGMFAFAPIVLIGMILIDHTLTPPWIIASAIVSLVIIVATAFLSFSKHLTRPLRPLFHRFLPNKAATAIEEIRQAIYIYRNKQSYLFGAWGLTIVTHLLSVFIAILVLKTITGTAHVKPCLFFIPTIEATVVALPITPNGIGIRDALSYFFLKSSLHLNQEQISIFILAGLLVISVKLLGLIAFIPWNVSKKNRH